MDPSLLPFVLPCRSDTINIDDMMPCQAKVRIEHSGYAPQEEVSVSPANSRCRSLIIIPCLIHNVNCHSQTLLCQLFPEISQHITERSAFRRIVGYNATLQ